MGLLLQSVCMSSLSDRSAWCLQGSATSTASGHTYGDAVAVKYSASDREASDDANSCEGADAEDERVFNAVGSSLGIAPVDSDPMLAHHPQKLEEQSDVLDTDRHADQDRHAHAVGMPATAFQAHAAVANGAIASKKMSSYTTQSHKHKAKHSLAAAKRSHTVAGELGQWGGAGDLGHHHRHGGGEGGVPGVPVAHIEGSWLSHINIDYKRWAAARYTVVGAQQWSRAALGCVQDTSWLCKQVAGLSW